MQAATVQQESISFESKCNSSSQGQQGMQLQQHCCLLCHQHQRPSALQQPPGSHCMQDHTKPESFVVIAGANPFTSTVHA